MRRHWLLAAVMAVILSPGWAPAQVLLGRVDDFQASATDTLGWTNGGINSPIVVVGGGPSGAGDNYLQVMANGGIGAGSRLISFNRTRWIGDFLNAGSPGAAVTSVAMDLKATSGSPLKIRIALKSGMLQTSPGYASTTPFDLPADGAWHHAVFTLDAASLTGFFAPAPLSTFLSNVAEFRILHSVAPSMDGDSIVGSFGVDNIVPVPEPSALMLGALGAVMLIGRRRTAQAHSRS